MRRCDFPRAIAFWTRDGGATRNFSGPGWGSRCEGQLAWVCEGSRGRLPQEGDQNREQQEKARLGSESPSSRVLSERLFQLGLDAREDREPVQ